MPELPHQEFIVVGRISKPFGLKGWSHITSYTEPPSNLLQYRPWALGSEWETTLRWEIVESLEIREHGDGFVARMKDCGSRELARELTGRYIGVPKSSLPDLSVTEYYWVDLVGCSIVNESDECLGEVIDVYENGAHSVLQVRGDDRELMIPFVEDVIKQVKAGSEIRVSWEVDW